MGLPRRRVGRSRCSGELHVDLLETSFGDDSLLDASLEVGWMGCSDEFPLDHGFEATVEDVDQSMVGPVEAGCGLAELGGVFGDGTRLLETEEVGGRKARTIGVAEPVGELGGEEFEVEQPLGRRIHREERLDPSVGLVYELDGREAHLLLSGLESLRRELEGEAELAQELGRVGGWLPIERFHLLQGELFGNGLHAVVGPLRSRERDLDFRMDG
jgi:hypothetical protein